MPANPLRRLFRKDRSPYWQAEYYDAQGRRHRVSTRCTDRAAAAEALRRLERGAQDPAGPAAHVAHPLRGELQAFVDRCPHEVAPKTVTFYAQKAGHLDRVLGDLDVGKLTVDDVARYIDARLKEKASRASIAKELVCLRQALKLSHARGRLKTDPRALVPAFKARYKPRQAYLTREQYAALWLACNPRRRLWLDLAVYTGSRKSEVERIAWAGVDLAQDTILIPGEKTTSAAAVIPLHPELRRRLEEVPKEKRKGLIVGRWLGAYSGLASACRRAGIVLREPDGTEHHRITPQFLRRTLGVWLKQDGVDSWVVARILRHKSTTMLEKVYAQPSLASDDQTRAAMGLPARPVPRREIKK